MFGYFKANSRTLYSPAVNGWTVCRFHGARGGAPAGKRNDMYRHGLHTKEAIETRRWISQLQRDARELLARLDEA